jgi:hypothetical protein
MGDYDATYNTQLDDYILNDKVLFKYYGGIYNSDDLEKMEDRKFYICNTVKRIEPNGEHWTVLFRLDDKNYFYDSFNRPSNKLYPEYHRKFKLHDVQLLNVEQPLTSENCGQYCLAFLKYIINRLKKKNMM